MLFFFFIGSKCIVVFATVNTLLKAAHDGLDFNNNDVECKPIALWKSVLWESKGPGQGEE